MSSFIEFFSDYTRSYNKKDIRVMKQAFRRYNEFLADTPIQFFAFSWDFCFFLCKVFLFL